jgi:DNA-binding transcriptional LysR family regulator
MMYGIMNNDVSGLSRLRQVDLNLLVVLRVLLEERSVTRAAARLRLGQPAVSGSLARLRDLLGDELLVRVGRGLRPTARAEALLEPVTDILARTEAMLWPLQSFDPGSLCGEIKITLGDYEEIVLLPELARRLAAEAPSVSIRAQSVSSDSRARLERGDTDLWITPFDQRWLDLPYETVLEDRWVGVGCAKAWAGEKGELGPLRSRPGLVVRSAPEGALPRDSTFRRHAFGDPLEVVYTASHSAAIPFLVAGSRRVAVMPERLARLLGQSAGIRILPWKEMPAIRRVVQWHPRSNQDPFSGWVRGHLVAIAASIAEEHR